MPLPVRLGVGRRVLCDARARPGVALCEEQPSLGDCPIEAAVAGSVVVRLGSGRVVEDGVAFDLLPSAAAVVASAVRG